MISDTLYEPTPSYVDRIYQAAKEKNETALRELLQYTDIGVVGENKNLPIVILAYDNDKDSVQSLQAKEGRRPRPVVPGSLRAGCFAAGKI